MKRFKKLLLTLAFSAFIIAPVFVVAVPTTSFAKSIGSVQDCETRILGMPPWFRGLVALQKNPTSGENECSIIAPNSTDPNDSSKKIDLSGFIWRIVLNVIEMGLFIVGYIALFFILYGGFQFLTGGSNPSQIEKARTTLLNAVIGLAISMASIAIVNLIFGVIL